MRTLVASLVDTLSNFPLSIGGSRRLVPALALSLIVASGCSDGSDAPGGAASGGVGSAASGYVCMFTEESSYDCGDGTRGSNPPSEMCFDSYASLDECKSKNKSAEEYTHGSYPTCHYKRTDSSFRWVAGTCGKAVGGGQGAGGSGAGGSGAGGSGAGNQASGAGAGSTAPDGGAPSGSDGGGSGGGTGGGAGGGCGLSASDPACNTCFQSACCAESQACASDTACSALIECVGGCSDQACVNACGSKVPAGIALYNNIASCLGEHCKTQCGL